MLFLNRSQGSARDEVFLKPRVNHQDRNGGEHDGCRLDGLGKTRSGESFQGGNFNVLHTVDDVVKEQLNGVVFSILHEHQRVGEAIPASYGIEESQGGDNRRGHGQVDTDKNTYGTRTVDFSRLAQAFGNGVEEAAHDDHVEYAKAIRNNQNDRLTDPIQSEQKKEGWNGTCVKVHGKDDQRIDEALSLKLVIGKWVSANGGHKQGKQGADDGQDSCPGKGPGILGVRQHHFISVKIKTLRPEINLIPDQRFRGA